MTSVPYPTFVNQPPVDASNGNVNGDGNGRAALSAVGKCRVFPETCFGSNAACGLVEFRAIVAKNVEQTNASASMEDVNMDAEQKAIQKKLQKKYMKEGVAMANKFLTETLQLDVSIVDVELYIDPKDLLDTDGFVAACFLDAGCHAIVTDGCDLVALECAKIPRDRLVAHFSSQSRMTKQLVLLISGGDIDNTNNDATAAAKLMFTRAASMASIISVEVASNGDVNDHVSVDTVSRILQFDHETQKELDYHIMVQLNPTDCIHSNDTDNTTSDLASMVGAILATGSHGHSNSSNAGCTVSLVDPSASQLGMSYAACIKTDRPDGLFATVVCTRSGEALGLVYSSKVRTFAKLLLRRVLIGSHVVVTLALSPLLLFCRNPSSHPWSVVVEYTIPDRGRDSGGRETPRGTFKLSIDLTWTVMEMRCDLQSPSEVMMLLHSVI